MADATGPIGEGSTSAAGDSTIDLLGRARQGDQAALDRLFARHLVPLRCWASGRLPHWARDLTDTDDLVQDVLIRTFKRIEGIDLRESGALLAYLRQAVLNRIRDELRRKARRPERVDGEALEADAALSPLEHAIGSEMTARYERALARLRPDEQEALIARVEAFAGLARSLGDIARLNRERDSGPLPRLETANLKALRRDPLLAEAQFALGMLCALDREWEQAQIAFTRALDLNPSATATHTDFVLTVLLPLGRLDASVRLLEKAGDRPAVTRRATGAGARPARIGAL